MADIKEVVRASVTNTGTADVTRVVIPKEIAVAAGVKKGSQLVVAWDEKNNQIIIKKF